MSFFATLRLVLLIPVARCIIGVLSWRQWLLTLGQRPALHHEEPYAGQPILLLALYEQGELRPDVLGLLQAASAGGFYVLAVNTLRLAAPENLRSLIHCYIERPNFGRDFGSYRLGFLHLYKRGWDRTCPRLLMLNDSVFYAARGLGDFLETMRDDPTEVLGATENFEKEHHLGSFCIAMAGRVLASPHLIRFWRRYRLSDLRPRVIRRGEMGLSKVLKHCVSSPAQLRALYGPAWFLDRLREAPDPQGLLLRTLRTADHTPAPRLEPSVITAGASGGSGGCGQMIAAATETFIRGSQIHQNALILFELGLPLVKLDLLYRGMFNIRDLLNLAERLETTQADELTRLLLQRPFGGQTLFGWRHAAFMRGLT